MLLQILQIFVKNIRMIMGSVILSLFSTTRLGWKWTYYGMGWTIGDIFYFMTTK